VFDSQAQAAEASAIQYYLLLTLTVPFSRSTRSPILASAFHVQAQSAEAGKAAAEQAAKKEAASLRRALEKAQAAAAAAHAAQQDKPVVSEGKGLKTV